MENLNQKNVTRKEIIKEAVLLFMLSVVVTFAVASVAKIGHVDFLENLLLTFSSTGCSVLAVYLLCNILKTPFERLSIKSKIRVYNKAFMFAWLISFMSTIIGFFQTI